ncbi:hypothetical protein JCM9957A_58380 [Kineosporia succinea]
MREGRLLFVPTRVGPTGLHVVRVLRSAGGGRTAIAFTDPGLLLEVMGPGHTWTTLSRAALLSLVEPLGVVDLALDPQLVAGPNRPDGTPVAIPVP